MGKADTGKNNGSRNDQGSPASLPGDDDLARAEANIGKEPEFFQYASDEEREAHEQALLEKSQAARHAFLEDAYSAMETAALLGISVAKVMDRAEHNQLLAVVENGDFRFPRWQFDANAGHSVPQGLADVLGVLDENGLSKYRQAKWLQRNSDYFEDGASPIEHLKAGQARQVLVWARSVGLQ